MYAIEFDRVTKTFPGVVALNEVTFAVQPGEIHALVGENGAGKSTLLNILHGVYHDFGGTVRMYGDPIAFRCTHDAIRAGISKVHQEISLVSELSVAQNIFLGYEPKRGPFIDFAAMHREAADLLRRLKSPLGPTDALVGASIGELQMVGVAKALFHKANIISFDEPTSSLSSAESDALMRVIRDLKSRGMTILYVSHRMDEIFAIADRVTVLRDGRSIGTFGTTEIERSELIRTMVGRDVSTFATRARARCCTDEVILRVAGLTSPGVFQDMHFDLHRGEILGFAGLVGAKRTEVVRAIFGADACAAGTVEIRGEITHIRNPSDAMRHGIGLVPENRKTEGFVRYLSNRDNIALTCLAKFQRFGCIDRTKQAVHARNYVRRLKISPPGIDAPTDTLSGGNQQKIVVAKWLSTDAEIIILDEPTKGIDVGAKEEMYALLEDLVADGKAVMIVSSELPEIIGLCDRVIVMKAGRKTAEFSHGDMNEERILQYSMEGIDT